jgi:hypothetical protein
MNPAESINDFMRQILTVNTVYRITYILSCSHNETESQNNAYRRSVMHFEDQSFCTNASVCEKVFQVFKYVQHFYFFPLMTCKKKKLHSLLVVWCFLSNLLSFLRVVFFTSCSNCCVVTSGLIDTVFTSFQCLASIGILDYFCACNV